MPLNVLNPIGLDFSGNKKLIEAKDLMKYSVVGGNAEIIDGNLVFGGSQSGTVIVRGEFFGLTADANIIFRPHGAIDVGEVQNENGVYSVSISNNIGKDVPVIFLVTVWYSDNRLWNVFSKTQTVGAGNTEVITVDNVKIPFYVENPIIKTFVLPDN